MQAILGDGPRLYVTNDPLKCNNSGVVVKDDGTVVPVTYDYARLLLENKVSTEPELVEIFQNAFREAPQVLASAVVIQDAHRSVGNGVFSYITFMVPAILKDSLQPYIDRLLKDNQWKLLCDHWDESPALKVGNETMVCITLTMDRVRK